MFWMVCTVVLIVTLKTFVLTVIPGEDHIKHLTEVIQRLKLAGLKENIHMTTNI